MDNSPHKYRHIVTGLSIVAGLLWLAVLAFLFHWLKVAIDGHLVPGEHSSWTGLVGLFIVSCLLASAGCYLTVRAWRGRSNLAWQAVSVIAALLFLRMISGD